MRREPLALPVIAEDGRVARIAPGALGLLRYGHVSLRDRLAIARVARRLGGLDPAQHDGETFAELLRRHGQSQAAIDRFWDVFMRPALNLRCEEVSAAPALFTVQTALLGEREASDLILPLAPLGAMHGDAAGAVLRERGAVVRTNARAAGLERGAVVLADGDRLEADLVVVALPPQESARLLEEPDPGLEDSPIVSAHLLFDRPILDFELAALLGSPAHWVFDRGALTGRPAGARAVPDRSLERSAGAARGARARARRPARRRAHLEARAGGASLVARQSRARRDLRGASRAPRRAGAGWRRGDRASPAQARGRTRAGRRRWRAPCEAAGLPRATSWTRRGRAPPRETLINLVGHPSPTTRFRAYRGKARAWRAECDESVTTT